MISKFRQKLHDLAEGPPIYIKFRPKPISPMSALLFLPAVAKVFGLVSWPWWIILIPWLIPASLIALMLLKLIIDGGQLHITMGRRRECR